MQIELEVSPGWNGERTGTEIQRTGGADGDDRVVDRISRQGGDDVDQIAAAVASHIALDHLGHVIQRNFVTQSIAIQARAVGKQNHILSGFRIVPEAIFENLFVVQRHVLLQQHRQLQHEDLAGGGIILLAVAGLGDAKHAVHHALDVVERRKGLFEWVACVRPGGRPLVEQDLRYDAHVPAVSDSAEVAAVGAAQAADHLAVVDGCEGCAADVLSHAEAHAFASRKGYRMEDVVNELANGLHRALVIGADLVDAHPAPLDVGGHAAANRVQLAIGVRFDQRAAGVAVVCLKQHLAVGSLQISVVHPHGVDQVQDRDGLCQRPAARSLAVGVGLGPHMGGIVVRPGMDVAVFAANGRPGLGRTVVRPAVDVNISCDIQHGLGDGHRIDAAAVGLHHRIGVDTRCFCIRPFAAARGREIDIVARLDVHALSQVQLRTGVQRSGRFRAAQGQAAIGFHLGQCGDAVSPAVIEHHIDAACRNDGGALSNVDPGIPRDGIGRLDIGALDKAAAGHIGVGLGAGGSVILNPDIARTGNVFTRPHRPDHGGVANVDVVLVVDGVLAHHGVQVQSDADAGAADGRDGAMPGKTLDDDLARQPLVPVHSRRQLRAVADHHAGIVPGIGGLTGFAHALQRHGYAPVHDGGGVAGVVGVDIDPAGVQHGAFADQRFHGLAAGLGADARLHVGSALVHQRQRAGHGARAGGDGVAPGGDLRDAGDVGERAREHGVDGLAGAGLAVQVAHRQQACLERALSISLGAGGGVRLRHVRDDLQSVGGDPVVLRREGIRHHAGLGDHVRHPDRFVQRDLLIDDLVLLRGGLAPGIVLHAGLDLLDLAGGLADPFTAVLLLVLLQVAARAADDRRRAGQALLRHSGVVVHGDRAQLHAVLVLLVRAAGADRGLGIGQVHQALHVHCVGLGNPGIVQPQHGGLGALQVGFHVVHAHIDGNAPGEDGGLYDGLRLRGGRGLHVHVLLHRQLRTLQRQLGARVGGACGGGHVHAHRHARQVHARGRRGDGGLGVDVGIGGDRDLRQIVIAVIQLGLRAVHVLRVSRAHHRRHADGVQADQVVDVGGHGVLAAGRHGDGASALRRAADGHVGHGVGPAVGDGHVGVDTHQATAAGGQLGGGLALHAALGLQAAAQAAAQVHPGAVRGLVQGVHHRGGDLDRANRDTGHIRLRRALAVAAQRHVRRIQVAACDDGVVQGAVAGDGHVHAHRDRAGGAGVGLGGGGGGPLAGGIARGDGQPLCDGGGEVRRIQLGGVDGVHVHIVHVHAHRCSTGGHGQHVRTARGVQLAVDGKAVHAARDVRRAGGGIGIVVHQQHVRADGGRARGDGQHAGSRLAGGVVQYLHVSQPFERRRACAVHAHAGVHGRFHVDDAHGDAHAHGADGQAHQQAAAGGGGLALHGQAAAVGGGGVYDARATVHGGVLGQLVAHVAQARRHARAAADGGRQAHGVRVDDGIGGHIHIGIDAGDLRLAVQLRGHGAVGGDARDGRLDARLTAAGQADGGRQHVAILVVAVHGDVARAGDRAAQRGAGDVVGAHGARGDAHACLAAHARRDTDGPDGPIRRIQFVAQCLDEAGVAAGLIGVIADGHRAGLGDGIDAHVLAVGVDVAQRGGHHAGAQLRDREAQPAGQLAAGGDGRAEQIRQGLLLRLHAHAAGGVDARPLGDARRYEVLRLAALGSRADGLGVLHVLGLLGLGLLTAAAAVHVIAGIAGGCIEATVRAHMGVHVLPVALQVVDHAGAGHVTLFILLFLHEGGVDADVLQCFYDRGGIEGLGAALLAAAAVGQLVRGVLAELVARHKRHHGDARGVLAGGGHGGGHVDHVTLRMGVYVHRAFGGHRVAAQLRQSGGLHHGHHAVHGGSVLTGSCHCGGSAHQLVVTAGLQVQRLGANAGARKRLGVGLVLHGHDGYRAGQRRLAGEGRSHGVLVDVLLGIRRDRRALFRGDGALFQHGVGLAGEAGIHKHRAAGGLARAGQGHGHVGQVGGVVGLQIKAALSGLYLAGHDGVDLVAQVGHCYTQLHGSLAGAARVHIQQQVLLAVVRDHVHVLPGVDVVGLRGDLVVGGQHHRGSANARGLAKVQAAGEHRVVHVVVGLHGDGAAGILPQVRKAEVAALRQGIGIAIQLVAHVVQFPGLQHFDVLLQLGDGHPLGILVGGADGIVGDINLVHLPAGSQSLQLRL